MAEMSERLSRAVKIGALCLAAAIVTGCQGRDINVRKQLGLDQGAPDEFLVVTKAPLTVPPNMDLLPPDPGAPAANAGNNPSLAAETATLGRQSTPAAGTSSGEAALLARAGASKADPRIRRRLRAENLATAEANETVTGSLLSIQRDQEETLDPEEEAKRLRRRRTGNGISAEDILSAPSN